MKILVKFIVVTIWLTEALAQAANSAGIGPDATPSHWALALIFLWVGVSFATDSHTPKIGKVGIS